MTQPASAADSAVTWASHLTSTATRDGVAVANSARGFKYHHHLRRVFTTHPEQAVHCQASLLVSVLRIGGEATHSRRRRRYAVQLAAASNAALARSCE